MNNRRSAPWYQGPLMIMIGFAAVVLILAAAQGHFWQSATPGAIPAESQLPVEAPAGQPVPENSGGIVSDNSTPAHSQETPGGNSSAEASVSQLFSPEDDLEGVWIKHIQQATRDIHIACYGLSNKNIASALEDAARRHVEVIILEDHRQVHLRSDLHDELASAGCFIIVKHSRVLLHDKFGVFDDRSALVGSYNLSGSAESQDNSDVVFDNDPQEAEADENAWELMFRRETGRSYTPGIELPPISGFDPSS